MRNLATIQTITDIQPIPGADNIAVATILGWQVVVKKGDFQPGQFCVYVEIDSILPDKPWCEFMRDRKFRVRTIKLRKQVSQGIAFPLSILPEYDDPKFVSRVGVDVTDQLEIKKYDPQGDKEKAMIEEARYVGKNKLKRYLNRFAWYRRLFFKPVRISFPSFIPKTDEVRIQNIPSILSSEQKFILTEKLDGQSGTYFLVKVKKWFKTKYHFGVCSRNFQLLKEDSSSYWSIARKYSIKDRLIDIMRTFPDNPFVAIQGEIIGPGIQGNKYGIDEYDFYVFTLRGDTLMNVMGLSAKIIMENHGMKFVPILADDWNIKPTMQENVDFSKGYSVLNRKTIREGVVVRNHNWSFKIINPDFLLKNDE